ncbi:unnamed protein product [Allacma fusca]|uniref:Transient receptor ion channel domain-containing protein n=1 Tax=Allacma fusca TaxID=39272 RepID=A0A8J2L0W6_9HEXA|nr:unnamed protein product [Allacma fusca]
MSVKTLPCDNSAAEEGRFKGPRANSVRMPRLPKALTGDEKKYLLAVDRGDVPAVRRMIQRAQREKGYLDINCVDPLGRGALLMAIEAQNLTMVETLIINGVRTADGLLHAIDKQFVEAVELLLEHEELIHKDGEPYSWENIDRDTATFTPEITPLILASHRNNYEILKILLDRGATLPMPHDFRCACHECNNGLREDCLRHSASRINSYKALASPSLIALTSTDPLLTSFELSWELKQLSVLEKEFRNDYVELRKTSQDFAVSLLSQTRTSHELNVMLNYDPHNVQDDEGIMSFDTSAECGLARLRLAIKYKQKKFVSHPWVQQLLAAMWYDGLPGFRQKSTIGKCFEILGIILTFPLYCMIYMIAPKSSTGKLMRKPFMKFLTHASSYLFFLLLLILVSQRVEEQLMDYFREQNIKIGFMDDFAPTSRKRQRGNPPQFLEYFVALYVLGFIAEETRELFRNGFLAYVSNMWNAIDFLRNALYCAVALLRAWAYLEQQNEIASDPQKAFIPREEWDDFDPQLIAEGLFAAANIFSALKLVHVSTINPHLGPLQISLGRMVFDILKFFFFYTLVLFAFACGLNQLLWYFADLEKQKCYSLPGGLPDWKTAPDSCMKWRRFGNLFESSQSLFWASFGMVGLADFELAGIKSYTRFWGLLMFGSYCVINVIVLLNLLIAMLSTTYAAIAEKADTEWKFARTKLWLSYFDEDSTLPSPFNLVPTPKHVKRFLTRFIPNLAKFGTSLKHREARACELREQARHYTAVMRALVWRYVSGMQRKSEEENVTEDDINEVKGEISALRCDLIEVFRRNGMHVDCITDKQPVIGRRTREWERKLLRGFHVAPAAGDETIDGVDEKSEIQPEDSEYKERGADRFRRMARLALLNRDLLSTRPPKHLSHIGRSLSNDSFKSRQSLRKAMDEAKKQVYGTTTREESKEEDSSDSTSQDSNTGTAPKPNTVVEQGKKSPAPAVPSRAEKKSLRSCVAMSQENIKESVDKECENPSSPTDTPKDANPSSEIVNIKKSSSSGKLEVANEAPAELTTISMEMETPKSNTSNSGGTGSNISSNTNAIPSLDNATSNAKDSLALPSVENVKTIKKKPGSWF